MVAASQRSQQSRRGLPPALALPWLVLLTSTTQLAGPRPAAAPHPCSASCPPAGGKGGGGDGLGEGRRRHGSTAGTAAQRWLRLASRPSLRRHPAALQPPQQRAWLSTRVMEAKRLAPLPSPEAAAAASSICSCCHRVSRLGGGGAARAGAGAAAGCASTACGKQARQAPRVSVCKGGRAAAAGGRRRRQHRRACRHDSGYRHCPETEAGGLQARRRRCQAGAQGGPPSLARTEAHLAGRGRQQCPARRPQHRRRAGRAGAHAGGVAPTAGRRAQPLAPAAARGLRLVAVQARQGRAQLRRLLPGARVK